MKVAGRQMYLIWGRKFWSLTAVKHGAGGLPRWRSLGVRAKACHLPETSPRRKKMNQMVPDTLPSSDVMILEDLLMRTRTQSHKIYVRSHNTFNMYYMQLL